MGLASNYNLNQVEIDLSKPTLLFEKGGHKIYWIGLSEFTAFRCNVYLIVHDNKAWLVDPGSSYAFSAIKDRVLQIIDLKDLDGLILCHQDPDVAASMVDWLKIMPKLKIYTTPRTQVLLPHYGIKDYKYVDVVENPNIGPLTFIEAPFLHFPGAFVTYDNDAECLFSGDIWAALDLEWSLTVKDFNYHKEKMDLFHVDYMASNVATRGFVDRIKHLKIESIMPQHGSIIDKANVQYALDYLKNLKCGTDIIYADMQE